MELLWLRSIYVCTPAYLFEAESLFAFKNYIHPVESRPQIGSFLERYTSSPLFRFKCQPTLRLSDIIALNIRTNKIRTVARQLKMRQEICILRMKLRFTLSFEILDLFLLLSRKWLQAKYARSNSYVSLISCHLDCTAKGQSVVINHAYRWNHWFQYKLDSITTQHLATLQMRNWNQFTSCGGRRYIGKLVPSCSRPNWLNPSFKNNWFTQPNKVDSSTTGSPLEDVDEFHSVNTLKLPHHLVTAFSIGRQRCVCPKIQNSSSGDVNKNFQ